MCPMSRNEAARRGRRYVRAAGGGADGGAFVIASIERQTSRLILPACTVIGFDNATRALFPDKGK